MRPVALFFLLAGLTPAPEVPRGFVQAVEFPYYAYAPQLWERELVWLKNLGIDTVAFSVPWNWHQSEPEVLDLVGRSSPRRDLIGFIRLVKRAGLRAWIRPAPPVKGWLNSGFPAGLESDRHALRKWLRDLNEALDPFLTSHGGPIAFVEGAAGVFKAPEPPLPVVAVSAKDSRSLVQSRQVFAAGHGSLLWDEVEDSIPPVGWEAANAPIFHSGAVSLAGEERTPVTPLRRDALLWRYWGAALPAMRPTLPVRTVAGVLPAGVVAQQLVSPNGTSAISVINQSTAEFAGALRAFYPPSKRRIALPQIRLAPGEALWLPIHIPLTGTEFCRDCSGFANRDHIIYATAELNVVEYENGILAMEFAAPKAGEVVVQLSQEPTGPLLAAGKPTSFDWDDKTFRARLPIPQGQGPGHRVRIGLAIQAPDNSAFFADAKRLTIGQKNRLETSYSSDQVAQRSRLILPPGFKAQSQVKSPLEIQYELDVPADSLHGDWAPMALEADGVLMSRARLQLLRPLSVRIREAMGLHFGATAELPAAPSMVPVDAQAGRDVSVVLHNNSPDIRNFTVEAQGEGLEFSPARTEIAIGGAMEREALIRVFPVASQRGVVPWRLHITGAAELDVPMRFAVIPRGETIAYSTDLENDGQLEWVLENQHARAIFSARDGGRWLEFVWKDSGLNVLPENGSLAAAGVADVQIKPDNSLEFRSKGRVRSVRLAGSGATLTVEQSSALPPETLHAEKRADLLFGVTRESPTRAVYSIERPAQQ
jgi:hypothetical protein